jgi:hypothetical protein
MCYAYFAGLAIQRPFQDRQSYRVLRKYLNYNLHLILGFGNFGLDIYARSSKVRKNHPLFCYRRQGSDRRWIEALHYQPDRHYNFLGCHHHFQIEPNAVIHVEETQQG